MTDRLFADCCYGTPYQHLPSEPCPQRFIHALEGVMNNPIARTALSDDLYKEIVALTSACDREELLSPASSSAKTYRGWDITFDYGRWTATGPDYDVSWEGYEDGYVASGGYCEARGLVDLIGEIDAYIEAALAAATGTAKTPKAVECEASQSGGSASERNAQEDPSHD